MAAWDQDGAFDGVHQAQHHEMAEGGDCSALLWGGLNLSPGGNSEPCNIRKTLNY